MATIDVSDVITDPDFMTAGIPVTRVTRNINPETGMADETEESFFINAVITTHNGDPLYVDADGRRLSGSITVTTLSELFSDTDIVIWKGRHYVVDTVKDWSHMGRGFFQAMCIAKELKIERQ